MSTLNEEQKTDVGVLPQPRPLEARGADKPRGWVRNGPAQMAVVQHSRGERNGPAKAAPVTAGVNASESGVSRVFVLDANKRPLMPTTPARARRLLKSGRAVVAHRYPFTIRLKDRKVEQSELQSVSLKLDPGSKTTGCMASALATWSARSFLRGKSEGSTSDASPSESQDHSTSRHLAEQYRESIGNTVGSSPVETATPTPQNQQRTRRSSPP